MKTDIGTNKSALPGHAPELAPGRRLAVHVEDMAFGGEGVARWQDFVIFIPFVVPGEDVEVELTEVKKRFARARLLRVINPSADRVAPLCLYFGDCGGCQYQHIAYERQLAIKHKQVCDLFDRVGGLKTARVDPVVPCPSPYGYRNRLLIRSQWNKPKQGLNIGFLGADNKFVVDLERCEIAEPALNEQIAEVRREPPPKGGLKISLRIAPEGWHVPPDSFFQTNFFLLPELVAAVRDMLRASGNKHLIDLYCGVGFFGLELAAEVESFVGVELDMPAIKAAQRNARQRGVTNGEFIGGAAEDLLGAPLERFPAGATTVLIDPPRRGCAADVLEQLRQQGPSQVIYVSCHPATQARDLNILCADDVFELKRVVPLDMFPQTQHVECVADLRRVQAGQLPPTAVTDQNA